MKHSQRGIWSSPDVPETYLCCGIAETYALYTVNNPIPFSCSLAVYLIDFKIHGQCSLLIGLVEYVNTKHKLLGYMI